MGCLRVRSGQHADFQLPSLCNHPPVSSWDCDGAASLQLRAGMVHRALPSLSARGMGVYLEWSRYNQTGFFLQVTFLSYLWLVRAGFFPLGSNDVLGL